MFQRHRAPDRLEMRAHQRGVTMPRGQPAGAVVLADGEFGNRHEVQQIVGLPPRERQRVRARVDVMGDMLRVRSSKEKRAATQTACRRR